MGVNKISWRQLPGCFICFTLFINIFCASKKIEIVGQICNTICIKLCTFSYTSLYAFPPLHSLWIDQSNINLADGGDDFNPRAIMNNGILQPQPRTIPLFSTISIIAHTPHKTWILSSDIMPKFLQTLLYYISECTSSNLLRWV